MTDLTCRVCKSVVVYNIENVENQGHEYFQCRNCDTIIPNPLKDVNEKGKVKKA
jgi:hypothetical protein